MTFLNPGKTRISDYRGCAVLIYSADKRFLEHYRVMFVKLGLTPLTATTPEAAMGILRVALLAYLVVDQDASHARYQPVVERTREAQSQVPIVIVSRKLNRDSRHEARAMGATGYLCHPAPQEDILQVLLPSGGTPGTARQVVTRESGPAD